MISTTTAWPRRLLLGACVVAAVFTAVVGGVGLVTTSAVVTLLLPFVAAALSVAALSMAAPTATAPSPGPARTTTAGQGGSLDQALTDLARILAEGTRARCAVVWLVVGEKLVSVASYSGGGDHQPCATPDLAALLARRDVDHAFPVRDGSILRAALTVSKPGRPVTPADQRLMRDIAQGAELLLRGAQLTTELEEQVRQADELAAQLQASRQQLTRAREVERQRLIGELTQVTTGRLAALRGQVSEIRDLLSRVSPGGGEGPGAEIIQQALAHARTGLDELLDRFRVIARGVYPSVLRDQGPSGALEELAADLPRPVRLSGRPARRLSWEVESGIYWVAASAMQHLASQPTDQPLRVHLEHTRGRLAVRVEDPVIAMTADEVLAELTDDVERLAALGGAVKVISDGGGGIALRAWLPDQLEPLVDAP